METSQSRFGFRGRDLVSGKIFYMNTPIPSLENSSFVLA
jgi:hypothetical protein